MELVGRTKTPTPMTFRTLLVPKGIRLYHLNILKIDNLYYFMKGMDMELEYKNAIFAKDDEGVMILTDITDMPPIVRGEAVYDGKNTIVINRNNKRT